MFVGLVSARGSNNMIEFLIILALLVSSYYVIGFLISITLGGVLELGIGSLAGLLWKNAVLAVAATIGGVAASYLPVPFAGLILPGVCAIIVLVGLYDMDFAEEWKLMLMFAVLFVLGSSVVQLLLVGMIGGLTK